MFGIGIIEVFIVLIIALFVIGPDKLPQAAQSLGRFVRTIRQYMNEIKRSVIDHNPMVDLQDQAQFDIPELIPSTDSVDSDIDEPQPRKKKIT